MLESIEYSKFISHKARISGVGFKEDLHSTKLEPTKLEWRPWILLKLIVRDLSDTEIIMSFLTLPFH